MKKKVLPVCFLALCLALCLALSVGMVFAGPSEAGANEQLAGFPSLMTKEGKWNTDYLSQLSDYIGDRFFLRQELISTDHWLSGKLFGVSGDPGVILGKGGWLYYADTLADYTGTDAMTDRELFAAANNLEIMDRYCRENGRQFLFVIAPNKNSLYNENMPDYGQRAELTDARRLLEELALRQVNTVDLFTAFGEQEQILYFAHDSHWNTKGAALGADRINEAFGVESSYYNGDFSEEVAHAGDLYAMLYPAFTDPEKDRVYGGKLNYAFTTSATRPDAIILSTESGKPGSLLAYRDSFGNLLFPFLADSYGTVRFSRSNSYDLTRESDYVLIELVERNLGYLTANLPVMPAPKAEIDLPDTVGGTVTVTAEKRGDWLQVKGQLPETDDDSPVYVACADGVYEAFCLNEQGFGLSLAPDAAVEYVVCTANGKLVKYEMQIQS